MGDKTWWESEQRTEGGGRSVSVEYVEDRDRRWLASCSPCLVSKPRLGLSVWSVDPYSLRFVKPILSALEHTGSPPNRMAIEVCHGGRGKTRNRKPDGHSTLPSIGLNSDLQPFA